MAHFAEIDKNNIVLRVVVFDDSFTEEDCKEMLGGNWKQTSYNSKVRKNFAGVGYAYDNQRNAFVAPKPDNSIGFDEDTCQWIFDNSKNEENA